MGVGKRQGGGAEAPERITDYTMKLISNARLTCMMQQIVSKSDTIRELNREISRWENENRMQAERIAGLEAVLYAAGVLDKDAVLATDSDKAWYADQVLERIPEVQA